MATEKFETFYVHHLASKSRNLHIRIWDVWRIFFSTTAQLISLRFNLRLSPPFLLLFTLVDHNNIVIIFAICVVCVTPWRKISWWHNYMRIISLSASFILSSSFLFVVFTLVFSNHTLMHKAGFLLFSIFFLHFHAASFSFSKLLQHRNAHAKALKYKLTIRHHRQGARDGKILLKEN